MKKTLRAVLGLVFATIVTTANAAPPNWGLERTASSPTAVSTK